MEQPADLNLELAPIEDTKRATVTARPSQAGESSFTVRLTDTASRESTTKEIPVDTEFDAARFWAPFTDANAASAEAGADDSCGTPVKINTINPITLNVGKEIEVAQPVPITVTGGKGPFTFKRDRSDNDSQDSEYVASSLRFIWKCNTRSRTCKAEVSGGITKERAHLSGLRKEIEEKKPRNTYIVTVTDEGCSGTQAKTYIAIEYKVDDEIVFDETEVTSRIRVGSNDTGGQSSLDAFFMPRTGSAIAQWKRAIDLEAGYGGKEGDTDRPVPYNDKEIKAINGSGVSEGTEHQINIAAIDSVRFIMDDPGGGAEMDIRIYSFMVRASSWCASAPDIDDDPRGYFDQSYDEYEDEKFSLIWWLCGDEKGKPAPARSRDGGGADGGCAKGAAAGATVSPMLAGPGCAVGMALSAIF